VSYRFDAACNPVCNRMYGASAGTNRVTVIDGATNAVIGTVAGGDSPRIEFAGAMSSHKVMRLR
jgi:YVTN family beta-propeller protein